MDLNSQKIDVNSHELELKIPANALKFQTPCRILFCGSTGERHEIYPITKPYPFIHFCYLSEIISFFMFNLLFSIFVFLMLKCLNRFEVFGLRLPKLV